MIVNRFGETIKGILYDIFSCEFELEVLAGDELLDYERASSREPSPYPEMDGYTFDRFRRWPLQQIRPRGGRGVAENPGSCITPSSSTATPASARRTCCWP